MEAGVEDLEFEVKPRSVLFEDKPLPCFVLYLEKGMQVIGRYQSGLKHNPKDSLYRFKNPQTGTFRLRNLNHATYTWNIYQADPTTGEELFEESSHFDLKQTVELYEMELLEKEREIQTSYKQKNITRGAVLELWSKAKKEMRNNRPLLKCIFQRSKVHVEFQIDIRNSLDLEILEEQGQRRQLRRVKSENSPLHVINNLTPSEILAKPKVSEPLIIIDECVSPLLRAAKKKHETEASNNEQHRIQQRRCQAQDADTTVVKVTNPTGQQLGQHEHEHDYKKTSVKRAASNSLEMGYALHQPNKKFSMLSDIIEQSHEGSSTFGHDKMTNPQNPYPQRSDEILGFDSTSKKGDQKNIVSVKPALNKYSTLPYDNFNIRKAKEMHHLKVDLRRAQTTDKDDANSKENSEQNMGDEYQTNSELKSSEGMDNLKERSGSSGDLNAKYIILVALLIILGVVGREWLSCSGSKCRKPKAPKRVRS